MFVMFSNIGYRSDCSGMRCSLVAHHIIGGAIYKLSPSDGLFNSHSVSVVIIIVTAEVS